MIVLLKGPTSTVATSQFESITSSTIVEFPKSSNAPEFLIESSILFDERGSNRIVSVKSESIEVMFTVGPEGEFSENATSEPEEAITEEFDADSRILVDRSLVSTILRLSLDSIVMYPESLETEEIEMSMRDSTEVSLKIGSSVPVPES